MRSSPTLAHIGQKALFVAAFCVILSMYGGGFATVPAYLADMFGARFVGAIHGRLLTAWSTAGVVGPFVVSYIRDTQIAAGVERALVYDRTHLYYRRRSSSSASSATRSSAVQSPRSG